jgi:hypothetical protein
MKRVLRFNHGIIGGMDKDALVQIIPQLENYFRQRKQYYEYYFDQKEVELSLEDIDKISNVFVVILNYEELIINLS